MKKHEILLKAMELYPFGAKFKSIAHNEECASNGVFYFNEESEGINSGLLTKVDNVGRYVYRGGKWAEIIKQKPLFLSKDGLDVFEDDLIWIPQVNTENGYYDEPLQFKARSSWDKKQNMFVNKELALKWIEQQKSKSINVKLHSGHTASVTKGGVVIPVQAIKHSDIEKISKAMQELS